MHNLFTIQVNDMNYCVKESGEMNGDYKNLECDTSQESVNDLAYSAEIIFLKNQPNTIKIIDSSY